MDGRKQKVHIFFMKVRNIELVLVLIMSTIYVYSTLPFIKINSIHLIVRASSSADVPVGRRVERTGGQGRPVRTLDILGYSTESLCVNSDVPVGRPTF